MRFAEVFEASFFSGLSGSVVRRHVRPSWMMAGTAFSRLGKQRSRGWVRASMDSLSVPPGRYIERRASASQCRFVSRLQRSGFFSDVYLGLRPRLVYSAPSALSTDYFVWAESKPTWQLGNDERKAEADCLRE